MKRGQRVVHGDKELNEKLGRNDPCPCGSARRFQILLPPQRTLSTASKVTTTSEIATWIDDGEAERSGS